MKKLAATVILGLAATIALAMRLIPFTSWGDLIDNSPEICIARCTATLDFISASNKPTVFMDNIVGSDIEVVSVLKGVSEPGSSHLLSQYWPYRGEYFLMFANYQKDQFNAGYTAIQSYRIVPLDHNFKTNLLEGKTLNEQVQFILSRRLGVLKDELNRDNEEEKNIESYLSKTRK